jgi:hypothetical protein
MKTFESFSPQSKVWIYQASREFTPGEHTSLMKGLNYFCSDWTAHDKRLKADFDIVYDRFIVLVVDETRAEASGCSIDKSVHFLKDAGAALGIDFFDKLQIPYMKDYEFMTAHFRDLKRLYNEGSIDGDTLFFDTNILELSAYPAFVKPLKQHWLMDKVLKP